MDLGQVFTESTVANYMVSLFSKGRTERFLEPCFGGGAFLRACFHAGFQNVDGCEIDQELFEKVSEDFPNYHLFHQDFLQYEPECRYDGIIMNPPYIRQEKINDLKSVGISKKKLRENVLFDGLPSTANLYMYFIIKAIELLKDDGELVVIFPSSWMQAQSGNEFKKMLFSKTFLKEEIHVLGKVFEKEALVDVVILKLVRKRLKMEMPKEDNIHPLFLELAGDSLVEKGNGVSEFEIHLNIPFLRYANVRRGLTTGWNTMFINPKLSEREKGEFITEIISSPKSVSGYNTEGAIKDRLLLVFPGQELNRETQKYVNNFKRLLLREKTPKALYEKAKTSKEWYTLKSIDSDGILFSYFVRQDMKFIMNTSRTLARDNFYIIYPVIDKYLMFALLNNFYTYYQLEVAGKKYGAGLLKVQRYDIEKLRFADIESFSDTDRERLIQLSKELIEKACTDNIEKITKILSGYTNIGFQEIQAAYKQIKRNRLEAS